LCLLFHGSRIADFASEHPEKEQRPLVKGEADGRDGKPSPVVHSMGLRQISDSGMPCALPLMLGFSGPSMVSDTAQQSLPNLPHLSVRSHMANPVCSFFPSSNSTIANHCVKA